MPLPWSNSNSVLSVPGPVLLNLECALEHLGIGLRALWFSRSEMEPEILPFQQPLRRCWFCWSRNIALNSKGRGLHCLLIFFCVPFLLVLVTWKVSKWPSICMSGHLLVSGLLNFCSFSRIFFLSVIAQNSYLKFREFLKSAISIFQHLYAHTVGSIAVL